MTTRDDYTSQDVADHLCQLTHASRLQRTGDITALRTIGERAYHRHYVWLEEHGINFAYDREAGCYVEVVSENDNHSQAVL